MVDEFLLYIALIIVVIPVTLYTIYIEIRKATRKSKISSTLLTYKINEIRYRTSVMCNRRLWGNGKIGQLFRKIRNDKPPPNPDEYWIQYRKDQEELAKQLYEDYNIGDGIFTTVKEETEKELIKILGQIITLTKKK